MCYTRFNMDSSSLVYPLIIVISPFLANIFLKKLNYKVGNAIIKFSLLALLLSSFYPLFKENNQWFSIIDYIQTGNWFFAAMLFCYLSGLALSFSKHFHSIKLSYYSSVIGFLLFWIGLSYEKSLNTPLSISEGLLIASISIFLPALVWFSYASAFKFYVKNYNKEINNAHRNVLFLIIAAIVLGVISSLLKG